MLTLQTTELLVYMRWVAENTHKPHYLYIRADGVLAPRPYWENKNWTYVVYPNGIITDDGGNHVAF